MRLSNGSPCNTARAMAYSVPTFRHCTPRSVARVPCGTSMPVRMRISCLAPPLGYLVGMVTTRYAVPAQAACMAAMACGLLFSMPISTSPACSACAAMRMPSTMPAARSRISKSSQLMNGSHSAPFTTSVASLLAANFR